MTKKYDFKGIESKWHAIWEREKLYDARIDKSKEKFYGLIEFPYPSGAGLHVGHPRPFTAMDIIARKRRAQGYNVLFPIGFDAFGLPAEHYAIKTGQHPAKTARDNIETFTGQLKSIGFSFAWNSAVTTTDPEYYKWTQWMFVQFYNSGLAYKGEEEIWWCPSCKIGIANEELENGKCERCGSDVVKKTKPAWMLKMRSYSDKLLDGFARVDYPDNVKKMQEDWIGRSEGAEVEFPLSCGGALKIYTTRPDTIDGVEFMVLSPEAAHDYLCHAANADAVKAYADAAVMKTDVERAQAKKKTGLKLEGLAAKNPHNGKLVPVYVSDYVIAGYGTGAIMAVPDLDERDGEFAAAMGIPYGETKLLAPEDSLNVGTRKVNYKMTDWVFSRQRYWGEPIPMVHCEHCGWVPVEAKDLPVLLPSITDYMPTEDGLSPLAKAAEWVKTTCPKCGAPAERETDTMPTWAGSSWYYLRYMDARNPDVFASKEALDYWGQVDWYVGGQEHITRHLLYSRFWHKALRDAGFVPYDEPYKKRSITGLILAANGEKMSKSKGNVVNPNDIVSGYGADTLRVYEMFIGPFDQAAAWSTESMAGVYRFLCRAHDLAEKAGGAEMSKKDRAAIAACVRDVSERIEQMKFNTAVSALMICLNYMETLAAVPNGMFKIFVQLLAPFAPHLASELWERCGETGRIDFASWPSYDEADLAADTMTIVVQVNGKKRAEFEAASPSSDDELKRLALDAVKIDAAAAKKTFVVPGRLVNIVV